MDLQRALAETVWERAWGHTEDWVYGVFSEEYADRYREHGETDGGYEERSGGCRETDGQYEETDAKRQTGKKENI